MARLLYITQDANRAQHIRSALNAHGHRAGTVTSSEQLEVATRADSYDLALVDVTSPTLNIFNLTKHLSDAHIPIVACADSTPPDGVPLRVQALALGCIGFIPADSTMRDRVERIEAYLNGRRGETPSPRIQLEALLAFGADYAVRLQERLEAWKAFHGIVIHEMRTSLAQVALTVEAMKREGDNEKMMRNLHVGLDTLQRHTEDLMAFLQADGFTVTPRPLDLSKVIEAYAEQHRAICEDCALRVDAETAMVEADEKRLRQVLDNLVNNAHRYVPDRRRPEITMTVAARNRHVVLAIEDNGVGVPPEQRECIFEPYTRLEAGRDLDARGLGIGLAVVREIVEAHGGRVVCKDSGNGSGARFEVRLPKNGHEEE